MKKIFLLPLLLLFCWCATAQIINIPDPNFKSKLISLGIDMNNSNNIEQAEANVIINLDLSNSNISNLTGINSFTNLSNLQCYNNNLTALSINGLANLQTLNCFGNQLQIVNLTNLPNLQDLNCIYNQIQSLNLTMLSNLQVAACSNNNLQSLNVYGMANLQNLTCDNNELVSLDLTGLSGLTNLTCTNNQIQGLEVSGLANLRTLKCTMNFLGELNVSGLMNLQILHCGDNYIQGLNVSGVPNLQTLWCYGNQMTNLNIVGLTNLNSIICNTNLLPNLNLNGLANLQYLDCSNNLLSTIDINGLGNLQTLDCSINQLNTLFIKNGHQNTIEFGENPDLQFVCADENEITLLQGQIANYGYENCHVNSYCSFTPGGTFYTIQGNNRYDGNANGCDAGDAAFPHLKLTFSNGVNTGSLITDATGSYHYNVQEGTYTITPVLDYPAYLNVPSAATVTFPAAGNPFTQDFCISPNGIHNDLEVTVFPITSASPGFNATYRILLRNIGNQTQSGSVHLVYDDSILDLVSANPGASSQSAGLLAFDFNGLQPFGTREVLVIFNINSQQEIPAVNGGDILNYTASIIAATDETPSNNTFVLHQTVVGSFDPNDKTCLEGNTITPEMVGKEVHYMIRFENTGTANAENIVVKDMIDMGKFDINSLIPIDGSHPFVTKISNTNKVEFIFENINLPFDDANNDGYIVFKIKTKPTLVVGNSFSNTASIYFDYNFPIITNTATTMVALLANVDFAFEDYFKIYPNPANDILNIDTKQTIEVTSINIYNTLGQIVLVIPNARQTKFLDVSGLKTGNYFMKINSDRGNSSLKFVKM